MLQPNAANRVMAEDALTDPYFASPVIDAEITTMRVANGKVKPTSSAVISASLGGDPQTGSTNDSRSASPATGTARSKLSALQNFMTKQREFTDSALYSSEPGFTVQLPV